MPISVVVLTFNSESTIERTVRSASRISDDIHVVDSYSTDKTLELLVTLPVITVQHPFENYGAQRNWAIDNLPLRHAWQLHLDADEFLSDELVVEINLLKESLPADVDGFLIPRKVCFLGRMLEHGGLYPKWHMRLFRAGKARCEIRRYDQHFVLGGQSRRLRHPMIDDHRMLLSEWTARHNRWADMEVEELFSPQIEGVIHGSFSGGEIERKRAWRRAYYRLPRFARAFALFFYSYFVRLGFLDGIPGLIYITLQVFWYRFLIDAKYYERQIAKR